VRSQGFNHATFHDGELVFGTSLLKAHTEYASYGKDKNLLDL